MFSAAMLAATGSYAASLYQQRRAAESAEAARQASIQEMMRRVRPNYGSDLDSFKQELGEMYRKELGLQEPVTLTARYGLAIHKPEVARAPRAPTFDEIKKHNLRRARAAWKGTDK